ncbi:putative peptidoglycan lipid II flippase [Persephonella hydrogeniphila]|uniref:Probable lipid II flippase MurJ n=1 Tax=Persephonella hydrogeniphila TaxID=198703 RepID=A0A285NP97_9AQUI|nr:murein biosynthesis integral membrane protein MurJ [Persephonella hydrogeniphila]SNZ11350.1 putative peptidoglycan lipid II flippase [Persephonella hydrogeniphila]
MSKAHFLKNTLFFSFATFISRVLGYIRDATVAYIFGANPLTDAFFVAWRIPNTLRQLVAEGSFNAAFIPIFTELSKREPDYSKKYISSLFSFYTLALSFLTFIGVFFSDFIVGVIAPGLAEKGTINEASSLLKLTFPYLILVGWVSFFMALLNTRDRFFVPAVSPALLNLSFILCAFFLSSYYGIYSLGIGALIGGILQVFLQIPFIIKEKFSFYLSFKILPETKETFKRLIPAFLSFGVSQFGFIVDTIIASFLIGGAISYLYYANRIFQLPIGLFAIGLGNALLVSLSKHISEGNKKSFLQDFNNGIRFAIFISIPATVGMIVLGKEIISVLLERGAFSQKNTELTYIALIGYSVGLTGYALTRPYKSAFFAKGDTKTPLYSTIFGVLISIVFAVIFGFLLNWGVFGLAFASSLGGIASFIYLFFVSDFKLYKSGILDTSFKTFVSAAVMTIAVIFIKSISENLYLQVFAGVFVGAFIYFFTAYILKENSVVFIASKLRSRL